MVRTIAIYQTIMGSILLRKARTMGKLASPTRSLFEFPVVFAVVLRVDVGRISGSMRARYIGCKGDPSINLRSKRWIL